MIRATVCLRIQVALKTTTMSDSFFYTNLQYLGFLQVIKLWNLLEVRLAVRRLEVKRPTYFLGNPCEGSHKQR